MIASTVEKKKCLCLMCFFLFSQCLAIEKIVFNEKFFFAIVDFHFLKSILQKILYLRSFLAKLKNDFFKSKFIKNILYLRSFFAELKNCQKMFQIELRLTYRRINFVRLFF